MSNPSYGWEKKNSWQNGPRLKYETRNACKQSWDAEPAKISMTMGDLCCGKTCCKAEAERVLSASWSSPGPPAADAWSTGTTDTLGARGVGPPMGVLGAAGSGCRLVKPSEREGANDVLV